MAQSVRVKEMEDYVKRLGELLNLVYDKMTDMESKVNPLKVDLSRLNKEVEDLKTENMRLKEKYEEYAILKEEYEDFMNRFIDGLKGLLPETPREEIFEHLAGAD